MIAAGRYPVPAAKGGAVSTLIENIVSDNEKTEAFDLEVVSPFDTEAEIRADTYTKTHFWFVKTPGILVRIESYLYQCVQRIRPHNNYIQLKSMLSFLWYLTQTAHILKKRDFDYVIIENTARLFWIFRLFGNGKKYSNKVIYHLHNEPKKLAGCNNQIINSKKIICVSDYIANKVVSGGTSINGLKKEKICTLYNSIDTNLFSPISYVQKQEIRESFGISVSDKVVVFVGRIDEEKGIRELLNALDFISVPNLKLLIVGSSFYGMEVKTKFEEEIQRLALKHREKIIYTGFIQYEKMPQIYGCADLSVLPSMWNEPAGLTIIESMSCGIPVITTVSGGIPEYASKECTILLKRDNNIVFSIAHAVQQFFENDRDHEIMSKKGRDHILSNFCKDGYSLRLRKCTEE